MSEWKINNIKNIHPVQHLLDCCLGSGGGSSGASGTSVSFSSCFRTRSLKNIYIYIVVVVVREAS